MHIPSRHTGYPLVGTRNHGINYVKLMLTYEPHHLGASDHVARVLNEHDGQSVVMANMPGWNAPPKIYESNRLLYMRTPVSPHSSIQARDA